MRLGTGELLGSFGGPRSAPVTFPGPEASVQGESLWHFSALCAAAASVSTPKDRHLPKHHAVSANPNPFTSSDVKTDRKAEKRKRGDLTRCV